MSRRIIFGFRAGRSGQQITNVGDIEMILDQMRMIVRKQSIIRYTDLVCRQAERIADEIVLDRFHKAPDISVLELAEEETNRRIRSADRKMQPTEYNLSVGAQVLVLTEKDGAAFSYIKVNCPGNEDLYEKKFSKIPDLIPCSLYEWDCEEGSAKYLIWDAVRNKYTDNMPLCCNLFCYEDLVFDEGRASFLTPAHRADQLAAEETANHALAMYSCGDQIQPHKLFELVYQALTRIQHPEFREYNAIRKSQLLGILPNITLDSLKKKDKKGSTPSGADT